VANKCETQDTKLCAWHR